MKIVQQTFKANTKLLKLHETKQHSCIVQAHSSVTTYLLSDFFVENHGNLDRKDKCDRTM